MKVKNIKLVTYLQRQGEETIKNEISFKSLSELKELQQENQKLKEQLQQKEDIINKAKDFIESYYDFMDEKYNFEYFDGYKLLEI